ncbi:MAG: RNA methyltransferase [Phycisphaeraceae bacterium]|nr:MAG: RNA methyltransferase [Phycisphaeraceae bacterium]
MSGPTRLNLIRIDDPDDPRLAVFANQRDQWLRARHRAAMTGGAGHPDATGTGLPGDLFIAEGDKVVRQLITSPHEMLSVMVGEHRLGHHLPFLEGLDPGVPVYAVGRGIIDSVAGFQIHRGLLACGRRVDQGTAVELARRSGVVVVLEDLANHDNVGGVFRNVRALAPPRHGSDFPACVLLTPRCCDPLYRKALRVSMGNALHVPFATIEPWPGGLADLAAAGCEPLALTPAAGAVDIGAVCSHSDRKPMLLLGTEGPGLTSESLEWAVRLGGCAVRLDIEPEADSLNVAVACAVALHRLRERPVSSG